MTWRQTPVHRRWAWHGTVLFTEYTDRTQMVSQKVFFNQRGVADINMRTICQQLVVPRKMTSLAPARPPSKVINTVNYFHCKCQVTLCTFYGDLTIVRLWLSPAGSENWHRFAVFILTFRCSRDWIDVLLERNVSMKLYIPFWKVFLVVPFMRIIKYIIFVFSNWG